MKHGGTTHYAVLVKSERVNGKPRQKFVAHVGSFNESNAYFYRHSRDAYIDFWWQIKRRLDVLGLAGDMRAKVEQQLAVKVPRPPEEEMRQAEADEAARERRLREQIAGMRSV